MRKILTTDTISEPSGPLPVTPSTGGRFIVEIYRLVISVEVI